MMYSKACYSQHSYCYEQQVEVAMSALDVHLIRFESIVTHTFVVAWLTCLTGAAEAVQIRDDTLR